MESTDGAQFARLLLSAFDAMVDEVSGELARAGHAGLTVGNEFAMQAIDEGADNAAALARHLGVTRQAAAKTILTLEGLGYVARGSDANDARRKNLRITERGRQAILIGGKAFDEVHARWQRTIGPDEAAMATRGLRAFLTDGST